MNQLEIVSVNIDININIQNEKVSNPLNIAI